MSCHALSLLGGTLMRDFKDIQSRNDLADFLKIPRKKLTYILYVIKADSYYTSFKIPKRNGESRIICAPHNDLKNLQISLYNALFQYQEQLRNLMHSTTNVSHGFEKGKNIISNAKIHRNKRYVLNIDLKNFFESFHFGRVVGYFQKNKNFLLPREVAIIIAQITCYNGSLPQGAPTSPIITNLIFQIVDMQILKIAKKYKLDYTRYADDLTFSTNNSNFLNLKEDFLSEISTLISKSGFSINQKKTRLLYKDSRQEVTGLIVNKKINVSRAYVRKTRAMAHQLYTTGSFLIDGHLATINQLEGRFSFINQVDSYNNKLDSDRHDAYHLNGRELEYRTFMFYKNFYAHDMPLILTEGKTDIRYLKAALMKLHLRYPDLIQRNDSGRFIFKVRFFQRSKQWKYFFDISLDGADSMKTLYHYFTGRKVTANYFSYLNKISSDGQKSPVILLYDNETETKRPLHHFLSEEIKPSDAEKEYFKQNLYLKLIPDSKLFLLTNPLVEEKIECEIEDLFSKDLLNLKLGGKSFCRNDKINRDTQYGKDVFSKYVFSNYHSIDFDKFIPLLDALDDIIKSS